MTLFHVPMQFHMLPSFHIPKFDNFCCPIFPISYKDCVLCSLFHAHIPYSKFHLRHIFHILPNYPLGIEPYCRKLIKPSTIVLCTRLENHANSTPLRRILQTVNSIQRWSYWLSKFLFLSCPVDRCIYVLCMQTCPGLHKLGLMTAWCKTWLHALILMLSV